MLALFFKKPTKAEGITAVVRHYKLDPHNISDASIRRFSLRESVRYGTNSRNSPFSFLLDFGTDLMDPNRANQFRVVDIELKDDTSFSFIVELVVRRGVVTDVIEIDRYDY